MKNLTALFILFVVAGCSTSLYHPKYGRVPMNNKYLDADISSCTKQVKKTGYKNTDDWKTKIGTCMVKKGWQP